MEQFSGLSYSLMVSEQNTVGRGTSHGVTCHREGSSSWRLYRQISVWDEFAVASSHSAAATFPGSTARPQSKEAECLKHPRPSTWYSAVHEKSVVSVVFVLHESVLSLPATSSDQRANFRRLKVGAEPDFAVPVLYM